MASALVAGGSVTSGLPENSDEPAATNTSSTQTRSTIFTAVALPLEPRRL